MEDNGRNILQIPEELEEFQVIVHNVDDVLGVPVEGGVDPLEPEFQVIVHNVDDVLGVPVERGVDPPEPVNADNIADIDAVVKDWLLSKRRWACTLALIIKIVYYVVGVILFLDHFRDYSSPSFQERWRSLEFKDWLNGVYFVTGTLTRVVFGDITPTSNGTKLFVILMALVGRGFFHWTIQRGWHYFLSAVVSFFRRWPWLRKGSWKWVAPLLVIIVFISLGTLVFHCLEDNENFIDSLYFSVTSIMGIGFGDKMFHNDSGKMFAVPWLILSSYVVPELFLHIFQKEDKTIYDEKVMVYLLRAYIHRNARANIELDRDAMRRAPPLE